MIWIARHPGFDPEMLGFLPAMLDENDPRPAREQFNANYGGDYWRQIGELRAHDEALLYPGDPPLPVLAETRLRAERVLLYPGAFVAIVQPDGSFVLQRMD